MDTKYMELNQRGSRRSSTTDGSRRRSRSSSRTHRRSGEYKRKTIESANNSSSRTKLFLLLAVLLVVVLVAVGASVAGAVVASSSGSSRSDGDNVNVTPSPPATGLPTPQPTAEPRYRALIENGAAASDIVVCNGSSTMVQLAGSILQLYIRNLTQVELLVVSEPGARVPFHIFVGRCSPFTDELPLVHETAARTHYDGFVVASGDNYLALMGDDEPFNQTSFLSEAQFDAVTHPFAFETPGHTDNRGWQPELNIHVKDGRGAMNAVFYFLRSIGFRFYYPDWYGTLYPVVENERKFQISVQHEGEEPVLVNPDFLIRDGDPYYKRFDQITWSKYPSGHIQGNRDHWLHWLLATGMNDRSKYFVTGYGHALDAVISRPDTGRTHPDWFSVWNGVRLNATGGRKPNLCSDSFLQATVLFLKTVIQLYNPPFLSIWPTDGFTRISEDPDWCKLELVPFEERPPVKTEFEPFVRSNDGILSDYVWNFVNDVAWTLYDDSDLVRVRESGFKLMCGAYSVYKLPPLRVRDQRGMCPYVAMSIHYWRSWTQDPANKAYMQDLISQWMKLLPGPHRLFTSNKNRHNVLDSGNQLIDRPFLFPGTIKEDIQFLAGQGIAGEVTEVSSNMASPKIDMSYDSFVPHGFNMWLTTRMYWTTDMDVDVALDEYFQQYFGPAAGPWMRQMYEYSEQHTAALRTHDIEHVDAMRALVEQALASVPAESVFAARVRPMLLFMNHRYEGAEISVTDCRVLQSPGTTYKLQNNVSVSSANAAAVDGACFPVMTVAVVLDCQGYAVHYNSVASAVLLSEDVAKQFTLQNCKLISVPGSSSSTEEYPAALVAERGLSRVSLLRNQVRAANGMGFSLSSGLQFTIANNSVLARGYACFMRAGGSTFIAQNQFTSTTSMGAYLNNFGPNDLIQANVFQGTSNGLRMNDPVQITLDSNTFLSPLHLVRPINVTQINNN